MHRRFQKLLYFLIPVILFLIIWHVFSLTFSNSQLLPSPIVVFETLADSLKEDLLKDVIASVQRVVIGFLVAAILGIFLGMLSGMNILISRLVSPILELLRPIPPIAWIPLAILWFGLGNNPAYFLVFLGAFFPIFTNTYFGMSTIEENYKRAAYSLGATKKKIIFDILLPASLPHMFVGLKVGLGIGWMAVITAELVGAQSGLGYMIQMNRVLLNVPKVIVGMVAIGIVGFLLNILIVKIEHKLIPWHKKLN